MRNLSTSQPLNESFWFWWLTKVTHWVAPGLQEHLKLSILSLTVSRGGRRSGPGTINDVGESRERRGEEGGKKWCLVSPQQLHNIHHNNTARPGWVWAPPWRVCFEKKPKQFRRQTTNCCNSNNCHHRAVTLTKPHQPLALPGSEGWCIQFTGKIPFVFVWIKTCTKDRQGRGRGSDLERFLSGNI